MQRKEGHILNASDTFGKKQKKSTLSLMNKTVVKLLDIFDSVFDLILIQSRCYLSSLNVTICTGNFVQLPFCNYCPFFSVKEVFV